MGAVAKLITLNRHTLTKISFPLKLFSDQSVIDEESIFVGLVFPNLRILNLSFYNSDQHRYCFESDRVSAIHAFLQKLKDIFPALEELRLSAPIWVFDSENEDEVSLCNLGNTFFDKLANVVKTVYPSV